MLVKSYGCSGLRQAHSEKKLKYVNLLHSCGSVSQKVV